ncbi:hypothetical protein BH09PSE4_BH09PSE4_19290 [soil metagenome]
MADRYALEFVGVKDGTQSPPKKHDGRLVGAKDRRIRASKAVLADAIGDRIFIGTLPQGSSLRSISINTDTSLGSATIAIGTTGTPAKYVAATTFTTPLDKPAALGPKASAAVAAPLTADEDIWVTVAAAALPVGAIVSFEMTYSTST